MSGRGDYWTWLQEVAIPSLYYSEEYNGDGVDEYNMKFLHDQDAMRLGPPVLRQLRVIPGGCTFTRSLMRPAIYLNIYVNSEFLSREIKEGR